MPAKTHGDSQTRLYHIYNSVVRATLVPSCEDYARLGAHGARFCDKWRPEGVSNSEIYKTGNTGWINFKKWAYTPKELGGGGYWDQPKDTPLPERLTIYIPDPTTIIDENNCEFRSRKYMYAHRESARFCYDGEETLQFSECEDKYHVYRGYINKRLSIGWPMGLIIKSLRHPEMIIRKRGNIFETLSDGEWYEVLVPNLKGYRFPKYKGDEHNGT